MHALTEPPMSHSKYLLQNVYIHTFLRHCHFTLKNDIRATHPHKSTFTTHLLSVHYVINQILFISYSYRKQNSLSMFSSMRQEFRFQHAKIIHSCTIHALKRIPSLHHRPPSVYTFFDTQSESYLHCVQPNSEEVFGICANMFLFFIKC